MKTHPKIALLIETSRSFGRGLLRGIAQFAQTRTNWSLQHQEMSIDAPIPDWLLEKEVRGVISRVDKSSFKPLLKLGVPIVDVRCEYDLSEDIPKVQNDHREIAQLAFEHLWNRGFRKFAFCGYQFTRYSRMRLRFFREFVEEAGCQLLVYETPSAKDAKLTMIEESGMHESEPLSEWLNSLEIPTGMFVCNDIRGQQVLNICRIQDISVPDDIGMIGVDDDDAICPLCDPPLSSVCPDAERIGFRAAEILNEMIHRKHTKWETEYVRPRTVVQRLSSQVTAVDDREVARVCRFIREGACEGIDVNKVVEFSTLSRRQLERQFKKHLRRTPHEVITSIQIAKVKQLLTETEMTLDEMAPLAGYSHKVRLSTAFKREVGVTPGEYRQRKAKQ